VEPEIEAPAHEGRPAGEDGPASGVPFGHRPDLGERFQLDQLLIGDNGLRMGWSVLIFLILYRIFNLVLGSIVVGFYPAAGVVDFSPVTQFVAEAVPFVALLGAAALVAVFDRRRIVEFNLAGPRRGANFLIGLGAGFAALSALVAGLAAFGWLHFAPTAFAAATAAKFGALWACTFLLVGCVEEGLFRCFLQSTLTRGINFWWALGIVGAACLDLLLRAHGQMGIFEFVWLEQLPPITGSGMWGVFAAALLGLGPCLALHLTKARDAGFWQAAWVTSTLFGFLHTGNNGENWIGIFAASAIGFVFCVSVWVTGSAWWAIGSHAAWDWAETYFYGTADSGYAAKGHFLTTHPSGAALWSGGADGPEGSPLALGAILLLLVFLLTVYGRGGSHEAQPAAQQAELYREGSPGITAR
jgi:hypothetical protein